MPLAIQIIIIIVLVVSALFFIALLVAFWYLRPWGPNGWAWASIRDNFDTDDEIAGRTFLKCPRCSGTRFKDNKRCTLCKGAGKLPMHYPDESTDLAT